MMLLKISDKDLWKKIEKVFGIKGGVYKLICYENGQPKIIQRFLIPDKNGILYIGKGFPLIDRVITLKKSLDPTYSDTNHECGVRYKTHPEIKNKLQYPELYVQLTETDNPFELEKKELHDYYLSFGELPPLNRRE